MLRLRCKIDSKIGVEPLEIKLFEALLDRFEAPNLWATVAMARAEAFV